MSKLETNTIDTISGSTNLTLGGTNATDITIPSGVTLTNNGTQAGLTLSDNILFNTASKGIYLGTTSATASNLLDDYEEGTWTADFRGTTGSAGSSSTLNYFSSYTKIGRLVHLTFHGRWSDIGSYTGTVRVYGLPFSGDFTNRIIGTTGFLKKINLDSSDGQWTTSMSGGDDFVEFFRVGNDTNPKQRVNVTAFDDVLNEFGFTLTYLAA